MNIVKPAIYTTDTCAIARGMDRLQWAMRNKAPNAEVVEIARNVQSAMIRLQEYIVRHYEGRDIPASTRTTTE